MNITIGCICSFLFGNLKTYSYFCKKLHIHLVISSYTQLKKIHYGKISKYKNSETDYITNHRYVPNHIYYCGVCF